MKKSMDNQTMNPIVAGWKRFATKHETIAQFLVFFVVSNGVTVLQMIMYLYAVPSTKPASAL